MENDRKPPQAAGLAARLAAFEVTRAVDGGTPWKSAWERAGASLGRGSRDRRLAHELASGSLRLQGRLDWVLARCSTRPLAALEPDVLALLRLGAYQILEMGGIREHAAVHTVVETAKRRVPRAAGYVNAVLRTLLRTRSAIAFPDAEREPLLWLETWGSHPRWIVERWLGRFGAEATAALCAYDNRRPALCLRTNRLRGDRESLLAALPGSAAGTWSPDAVRAATAAYADVRRVVEIGLASVQDESGMLVAPLLEPRPGSTLLDVAAAPGGKACHLAELQGGVGAVFAYDRSAAKLAALRDNVVRLGLGNVVVDRADARTLERPAADGVLLDAPCSGLGVLARRPDLRWRKRPDDLPRLGALQSELLEAAARLVRPGGLLVYSVCSFEPEETETVVARFAAAHPEFQLDDPGLPEALRGGPGLLYFYPHRHGLDGGFAARWRRREGG